MDRLAIEVVLAGPRAIEHPDDAEQRRFSGSRGAHEGDKLARLNLQRYAAQNVEFAAARLVNLLHVPQLNQWFHARSLAVNRITPESSIRFETITLKSAPLWGSGGAD